MSLIVYKGLAALLIFIISAATILYLFKYKTTTKLKESFELGEALASGIFLGVAFFHMLPDSIKMFDHLYPNRAYPIPEAICVFGFLFLLFLERLSLTNETMRLKNSIPYILAFTLSIHALTEGGALGLEFSYTDTFMIFIAIIAHKSSESFALFVTLIRHELTIKRTLVIALLFALMTPIGIALGTTINALSYVQYGELAAAIFNAFAAGTFLYISTLHHVHFHKHAEDARGMMEFSCLVLGAFIMGVLAIWT